MPGKNSPSRIRNRARHFNFYVVCNLRRAFDEADGDAALALEIATVHSKAKPFDGPSSFHRMVWGAVRDLIAGGEGRPRDMPRKASPPVSYWPPLKTRKRVVLKRAAS